MQKIAGKQALVSGAASGIGRAIALALARAGANLVLVDNDASGLEQVADQSRRLGSQVRTQTCDLGQATDVHQVVQRVLAEGGIDILVNNAGVLYWGPTESMTLEQWKRVLAVNLHAAIQLTREFLPSLLARGQGHILFVSSLAGLMGVPYRAVYTVSKFGLVGFADALRAEFGWRGLGVTALCPGFVRTNLFQTALTAPGRPFPRPAGWDRRFADAEAVAVAAVQAIRQDRAFEFGTPGARFIWRLKRLFPRVFDKLHARAARHEVALGPPATFAESSGRRP